MTTLQKTLIGATLVIAVGTGIYEGRQASLSRSQAETLQQQQGPLAERIEQLTRERDAAAGKLAALQRETERLSREAAELPKLRGELTRLRALAQQLGGSKAGEASSDDAFTQSVLGLTQRAGELNQHLQLMPDKKIPELQFLAMHDWLGVAETAGLQSEADVRKALAKLRDLGKENFGTYVASPALDKFIAANNGQLPTDVAQLKPYFGVPVDDQVLQRYQVVQTGDTNSLKHPWVLSEKGPVDQDYDSHFYIGPQGACRSFGTGGDGKDGPAPWATR